MLREQDRFLPIANIAKIMKKAIPNSSQGKIAKDAVSLDFVHDWIFNYLLHYP